MAKKKVETTDEEYTKALKKAEKDKIILKLYVAGLNRPVKEGHWKCKEDMHWGTPRSMWIEVIDIYKHPILAKGEQIIATHRLIGDMADKEKFLVGLDVRRAS